MSTHVLSIPCVCNTTCISDGAAAEGKTAAEQLHADVFGFSDGFGLGGTSDGHRHGAGSGTGAGAAATRGAGRSPAATAGRSGASAGAHVDPAAGDDCAAGIARHIEVASHALKLLPGDAAPMIVILTDGVLSVPDLSEYDNLVMQLVRHDISCHVVQVGGAAPTMAPLGLPADPASMQYLAIATGGAHLVATVSSRGISAAWKGATSRPHGAPHGAHGTSADGAARYAAASEARARTRARARARARARQRRRREALRVRFGPSESVLAAARRRRDQRRMVRGQHKAAARGIALGTRGAVDSGGDSGGAGGGGGGGDDATGGGASSGVDGTGGDSSGSGDSSDSEGSAAGGPTGPDEDQEHGITWHLNTPTPMTGTWTDPAVASWPRFLRLIWCRSSLMRRNPAVVAGPASEASPGAAVQGEASAGNGASPGSTKPSKDHPTRHVRRRSRTHGFKSLPPPPRMLMSLTSEQLMVGVAPPPWLGRRPVQLMRTPVSDAWLLDGGGDVPFGASVGLRGSFSPAPRPMHRSSHGSYGHLPPYAHGSRSGIDGGRTGDVAALHGAGVDVSTAVGRWDPMVLPESLTASTLREYVPLVWGVFRVKRGPVSYPFLTVLHACACVCGCVWLCVPVCLCLVLCVAGIACLRIHATCWSAEHERASPSSTPAPRAAAVLAGAA